MSSDRAEGARASGARGSMTSADMTWIADSTRTVSARARTSENVFFCGTSAKRTESLTAMWPDRRARMALIRHTSYAARICARTRGGVRARHIYGRPCTFPAQGRQPTPRGRAPSDARHDARSSLARATLGHTRMRLIETCPIKRCLAFTGRAAGRHSADVATETAPRGVHERRVPARYWANQADTLARRAWR